MMYSIVIPVYNTVDSLKILVEQLGQIFNELGEEHEIIFVNDNSPNPETWKTLKLLSHSNTHITSVLLSRNFGQQSATLCGFAQVKGDYVITMDDDLQHSPNSIKNLLEYQEHDIVIGHFKGKKHSLFKRLTSAIKSYFDRIILGKPKGVQLSAFRLLKRKVVDGMLSIETPTPFIPALMFYISKDVKGVEIEHNKRHDGSSGYSLIKLIKLFSYLIINNSSLLLRFIGYIGLVISFLSFLFIIRLVIRYYLFDSIIQGWTSTIIAIFFFGGLQLFTLGIIGEYLIRIIRNVEKKPPYYIKEILK